MINIQSPKLEAPSLVTITQICIYKAINNEQTKVLLIVHERFISSHACTQDQVKVLREFLEILNSQLLAKVHPPGRTYVGLLAYGRTDAKLKYT